MTTDFEKAILFSEYCTLFDREMNQEWILLIQESLDYDNLNRVYPCDIRYLLNKKQICNFGTGISAKEMGTEVPIHTTFKFQYRFISLTKWFEFADVPACRTSSSAKFLSWKSTTQT